MTHIALSRATRSITIASLVALATLLGRGVATAQSTDGPIVPGQWTVTPFVGFGFSGDLDSSAVAFGTAGGYNWNSKVSLEGEINLLPSFENSGVQEFDLTGWSLTGNLLYHFARRGFTPYGVLGMGVGHASADLDDTPPPPNSDTSSTEFVFNLGGGIERRIRDRLRFRGDLRYFFAGNLVPDYWRMSAGVTIALTH